MASTSFVFLEARVGIEPTNKGFAVHCLPELNQQDAAKLQKLEGILEYHAPDSPSRYSPVGATKFTGRQATDKRAPLLAGKQRFYPLSNEDHGDNALGETAVLVITSDDPAHQLYSPVGERRAAA